MSVEPEGAMRTEILKASPPMFESRLLDACSRVHPSVPVILFPPAITFLIAHGIGRVGTWDAVARALGGYVLWTLTEYWIHRVVFHFEPEDGIGAAAVRPRRPDDQRDAARHAAVGQRAAGAGVPRRVLARARQRPAGARRSAAGRFLAGYLVYDMTHYHGHHHKPADARRPAAASSCTCAATSRYDTTGRHQRPGVGSG